jgi:hypothetical protein
MRPLSITVLGSHGVDGIMELTEVSRSVEETEGECAACGPCREEAGGGTWWTVERSVVSYRAGCAQKSISV